MHIRRSNIIYFVIQFLAVYAHNGKPSEMQHRSRYKVVGGICKSYSPISLVKSFLYLWDKFKDKNLVILASFL